MNFVDSFIVWHSKRTDGRIRSFLAKIYLFLVRVKNFLRYGESDLFNFVNIELNRNCNRSCSYCPKSDYEAADEVLDFSTFKKIIADLEEVNYSEKICFTGYYEPLIASDLEKFVNYITEKLPAAKIIIYTNGDKLTPELYDNLKRSNLFFIISIHDKDGKKRLKELKKITSSEDTLFKTDLENYILSSRGGLVEVEKKETKYSCVFPSSQLTIDSSGNVILCFDDYFSENIYGNVRERNLFDIWRDPEFVKVRKKLLSGEPVKDICKSCFD